MWRDALVTGPFHCGIPEFAARFDSGAGYAMDTSLLIFRMPEQHGSAIELVCEFLLLSEHAFHIPVEGQVASILQVHFGMKVIELEPGSTKNDDC